MSATIQHHRNAALQRTAYCAAGCAIAAAIALELIAHGTGWWQLVALGLGPDSALLLGAGRGLERGQLHRRAVPLYNALHRSWGPIAVLALAAGGLAGRAWLVGGLAWALHVALDRALGYGLRTADGRQRRA